MIMIGYISGMAVTILAIEVKKLLRRMSSNTGINSSKTREEFSLRPEILDGKSASLTRLFLKRVALLLRSRRH